MQPKGKLCSSDSRASSWTLKMSTTALMRSQFPIENEKSNFERRCFPDASAILIMANTSATGGLFSDSRCAAQDIAARAIRSIHLLKDDPAGCLRRETECEDAMVAIRMKDKVSEVAGIKLVAAGGIEWDRRIIGNFSRQSPAFDR